MISEEQQISWQATVRRLLAPESRESAQFQRSGAIAQAFACQAGLAEVATGRCVSILLNIAAQLPKGQGLTGLSLFARQAGLSEY